jgi:hypothetical protein
MLCCSLRLPDAGHELPAQSSLESSVAANAIPAGVLSAGGTLLSKVSTIPGIGNSLLSSPPSQPQKLGWMTQAGGGSGPNGTDNL